MGGGAPDPEGKASAKRKRIDALDRRLAGGKGASPGARASASRPGDGPRGRDGDRPSSARRDARGARAGGRGARDANPAVHRPPGSRPRSVETRAPPEAPADAPWYAPLSARVARGGALAAARGAGPLPLPSDARQARTAYVERALVALAETSERTGADVDAVVRGKTRDKVLLLDAADAGGATGARARRRTSARAPKSAFTRYASNAWLRLSGVRGALPSATSLRDTSGEVANEDDARERRETLAHRLAERARAPRRALLASLAEASREKGGDKQKRLAEVKRLVLELGEVRGGTVRVVSCRDGKLVGRRGVVARVTARAAHVVASPRATSSAPSKSRAPSVFVAPRKGTTFRLELESLPGEADEEGDSAWVDIKGENLAGG